MLPTADVVVVLLPLTPGTRGMIDCKFMARMRPGALLVNAGRHVPDAAVYAYTYKEHCMPAHCKTLWAAVCLLACWLCLGWLGACDAEHDPVEASILSGCKSRLRLRNSNLL